MSDYGNDWDYNGELNEKDEEIDENRNEGTKLEEKNKDFNPNEETEAYYPTDNRLKNLWVCENEKEHQSIQSSLLTFVDELLKSDLISFENGEYKIKVKNK